MGGKHHVFHKGQVFYVQEGCDNEDQTNNVSVRIGINKYDEEDRMTFRDAIMSQRANQIGKDPNASLTGSGLSTDQGYMSYMFLQSLVTKNGVYPYFLYCR